MITTRRDFVTTAAAFGTFGASAALDCAERPIWTAGIMTDTHVYVGRKDASLVKRACELFARHDVDLVANCGDICDVYQPSGYAAIRAAYDEAFAKKRPEEIWVYAYHDWVRRLKEPHDAVMADVQRHLGAKNGCYAALEFKGYPLVVVPQMTWEEKRVEEMISSAEKSHPDPAVPVFVFDHEAGFDTNDNTVTWGTGDRRRLYGRHPRVILISGHAHSSLHSELNCWLGSYASINAGCLDVWRGDAVSYTLRAKPEYGVLIMEVYKSRVVFRRFDVRDGIEYMPDRPWTVPLPFTPSDDPFARVREAERQFIPQFPAGAALDAVPDGDPLRMVNLSFPAATGGRDYVYRIDFADEGGKPFARRDEYGQFYLRESERVQNLTLPISAGYFDEGRKCRISVTPCDCFGRGGKPISATFTATRRGGMPAWDCENPMKMCAFRSSGGKSAGDDGFCEISSRANRLELPDEAWDGAKGTKLRLIADFELRSERTPWALVVCDTKTSRAVNSRVYTPRDPCFRQRAVIEFTKPTDDFKGSLVIKEGGKGLVRFNHVRVERIV